jgi:ABC-type antimicrobial peptide transport system permease subunit
VEKSLVLFEIFVGLVGTIALILAFFLLLISTTQNIKENVWEYGCLRAMGFTKAQGIRAFMYEQYSLVLSSLILGCLVGFILSAVVTAQFYLFLEYPFKFILPEGLLWTMVVMSLITTFFATLIPIREVNKK